MRPGLGANAEKIKIAVHRLYWQAECVSLERRRAETCSNSFILEQLASVDPTEARRVSLWPRRLRRQP
jgi:hypothetical protein